MKYLITGGAGFIGSNYLNYVYNDVDQYVCIDCLSYAANMDNIKDLMDKPNFKFIKEDICNEENIEKIFKEEKFDYVIHFAAETHVDNSINNYDLFYRSNVVGTRVLLDASVKYGVKRFHHISTDEVYGSLELDSSIVFTEKSKLNPTNNYSKTKALAEELVFEYYNKYDLDVTVTRSSNNYGLNQYREKLIPKIIYNALNDLVIPIYGDGSNKRDWLYVLDNCSAIDLVVHKGVKGEVYNVCSNEELTNNEVVRLILKELNKDESLIRYVKDRPNHDKKYTMDCSKVMSLGWSPKYKFKDTIKYVIK